MKTGEVVREKNGCAYQVGPLLGRGLWGKCYAAKDDAGRDVVLKVALSSNDLDGDTKLAAICEKILDEQAVAPVIAGQIPLLQSITLDDGIRALVLPKAKTTWERAITAGSVLDSLTVALGALKALAVGQGTHAAIKPGNVLVMDDGEVVLSDPATPTQLEHYRLLLTKRAEAQPYLPPEARLGGSPSIGGVTDTYSVAMGILRAVRPKDGAPLPLGGMDKVAVVAAKDDLLTRLGEETSNPRFHTRLVDRFGAVINRALSAEVSPTPPYRFASAQDLHARLAEVAALVHPSVTHVGNVVLDRPTSEDCFTTDEDAVFSVTVGSSDGVDTHEELACGVAVYDSDGERLREVPSSYTVDRHPSGRFRFKFRLSDLDPGAYTVRLAFTIHESGEPPATAEISFGVVAAAGYTPLRAAPEPTAIPLERAKEATEPDTEIRNAPVEPIAAPQLHTLMVQEHTVPRAEHEANQVVGDQIENEAIDALLHAAGGGMPAPVAAPRNPTPVARGPVDNRPTLPSIPSNVTAEAPRSKSANAVITEASASPADVPWDAIPIPNKSGEDLFMSDRTDVGPQIEDPYAPRSNPFQQVVDAIAKDPFRMFVTAVLLLIAGLLAILIFMN